MRKELVISALLLAGCTSSVSKLPVLGEPTVSAHQRNGATVYDTVYPVIPSFSFTDQDSLPVTEKSFAGKVYVADFIFLSCPNICPKMTAAMKKVYSSFK